MVSSLFTGFLEKNRDVLSTDILTLIHSSQNKFLKEIFKLEAAEIKLGHGTIQRKTRSQFFKVGPMVVSFSATLSLGPLRLHMSVQRKPIAWDLGFSV